MSVFSRHDVVCVGNALVDVQAPVPESYLIEQNLTKGAMMLVDAVKAAQLYSAMPPAQENSGGSGANSIAVLASLGGSGGFIARIGKDDMGDIFAHDLAAQGVTFAAPDRDSAAPTGRCLIAVTPDGERTMSTNLGCNVKFSPKDLTPELIESAKVLLLEGYLFDQPHSKEAFRAAVKIAKAAGVEVALSLSAEFCVNIHRADFLALVESGVDILFANETEIKALYEMDSFEAAAAEASKHCKIAVLTHGSRGALIYHQGKSVRIPAVNDVTVVDLTGAGDAYAGAFLYGYTHGFSMAEAGRLASLCAAEVISHFGARPQMRLADLIAQVRAA